MRPEATERARAYIASPKTPRAIAGQSGDKTTYAVACTLAVDFALDDGAVAELLGVYNATKCDPQWGPRDLDRFVRSARKCASGKPGEVGKLLNVDRENYTGPSSPANTAAGKTAPKMATPQERKPAIGAPNASGPSGRTPRTPFFEVRRAGEGAERRPSRTLRTALFLSSQNKERREESKQTGSTSQPSAVSAESARTKASEPSAPQPAASLGAANTSEVSVNDQAIFWANGEHWRKKAGESEWENKGNINQGRKRE